MNLEPLLRAMATRMELGAYKCINPDYLNSASEDSEGSEGSGATECTEGRTHPAGDPESSTFTDYFGDDYSR
jgi:hypothetical protein